MTAKGLKPSQSGKPVGNLTRLYSVAHMADQLGVSQKTVRRMIADGRLPACRIGRQLRISEHDLAAFIARSRFSRGG
jgi:excisionase family DNA binding protein